MKIGITEWNTSIETKLKVVTHATGQCVNPADLKAGLRLSAKNGIDIDCNLRLSKDGELVLVKNLISLLQ